jgi:hypothetical protein
MGLYVVGYALIDNAKNYLLDQSAAYLYQDISRKIPFSFLFNNTIYPRRIEKFVSKAQM